MADKHPLHPEGSILTLPDGSQYVYIQAADNLERGTYAEPTGKNRIKKFSGGLRFPKGLVMETVPENYYTFVMVQESQPNVPAVEKSPIITK